MKLKKIQIFILKFDFGSPWPNEKLFFQDANFLLAALTIKGYQKFQKTKSEEMVAVP